MLFNNLFDKIFDTKRKNIKWFVLRLRLLFEKLRKLFENLNKKNQLFLIIHYLRLWNIKSKKIKERDVTLEEELKRIKDKIIQNDTKTLKDRFLIKKINHEILLFYHQKILNFKKIITKINKNKKITDLFEIKRVSLLKNILNNLINVFIRYIIILQFKKIIKKIKCLQKILILKKLLKLENQINSVNL